MECQEIKEKLSAWIDGELNVDMMRKVTDHLAACEKCSTQATELKIVVGMLNTMAVPPPKTSLKRRIMRNIKAGKSRGITFYDYWRSFGLQTQALITAGAMVCLCLGFFTASNTGVNLVPINNTTTVCDCLSVLYKTGGLLIFPWT